MPPNKEQLDHLDDLIYGLPRGAHEGSRAEKAIWDYVVEECAKAIMAGWDRVTSAGPRFNPGSAAHINSISRPLGMQDAAAIVRGMKTDATE